MTPIVVSFLGVISASTLMQAVFCIKKMFDDYEHQVLKDNYYGMRASRDMSDAALMRCRDLASKLQKENEVLKALNHQVKGDEIG